eukprot:jgi/Hompol1/4605/HPOL_003755-RA
MPWLLRLQSSQSERHATDQTRTTSFEQLEVQMRERHNESLLKLEMLRAAVDAQRRQFAAIDTATNSLHRSLSSRKDAEGTVAEASHTIPLQIGSSAQLLQSTASSRRSRNDPDQKTAETVVESTGTAASIAATEPAQASEHKDAMAETTPASSQIRSTSVFSKLRSWLYGNRPHFLDEPSAETYQCIVDELISQGFDPVAFEDFNAFMIDSAENTKRFFNILSPFLERVRVVGLDIEVSPRKRSDMAKIPSTIQISFGSHFVVIFQTYRMCCANPPGTKLSSVYSSSAHLFNRSLFPASLGNFLANSRILKVGVGIHRDAEFIRASFGYTVNNALCLSVLSGCWGLPQSLSSLSLKYCGYHIQKNLTFSSSHWWDAPLRLFDQKAIRYAAYDAYMPVLIFRAMINAPERAAAALAMPVSSQGDQPTATKPDSTTSIPVSAQSVPHAAVFDIMRNRLLLEDAIPFSDFEQLIAQTLSSRYSPTERIILASRLIVEWSNAGEIVVDNGRVMLASLAPLDPVMDKTQISDHQITAQVTPAMEGKEPSDSSSMATQSPRVSTSRQWLIIKDLFRLNRKESTDKVVADEPQSSAAIESNRTADSVEQKQVVSEPSVATTRTATRKPILLSFFDKSIGKTGSGQGDVDSSNSAATATEWTTLLNKLERREDQPQLEVNSKSNTLNETSQSANISRSSNDQAVSELTVDDVAAMSSQASYELLVQAYTILGCSNIIRFDLLGIVLRNMNQQKMTNAAIDALLSRWAKDQLITLPAVPSATRAKYDIRQSIKVVDQRLLDLARSYTPPSIDAPNKNKSLSIKEILRALREKLYAPFTVTCMYIHTMHAFETRLAKEYGKAWTLDTGVNASGEFSRQKIVELTIRMMNVWISTGAVHPASHLPAELLSVAETIGELQIDSDRGEYSTNDVASLMAAESVQETAQGAENSAADSDQISLSLSWMQSSPGTFYMFNFTPRHPIDAKTLQMIIEGTHTTSIPGISAIDSDPLLFITNRCVRYPSLIQPAFTMEQLHTLILKTIGFFPAMDDLARSSAVDAVLASWLTDGHLKAVDEIKSPALRGIELFKLAGTDENAVQTAVAVLETQMRTIRLERQAAESKKQQQEQQQQQQQVKSSTVPVIKAVPLTESQLKQIKTYDELLLHSVKQCIVQSQGRSVTTKVADASQTDGVEIALVYDCIAKLMPIALSSKQRKLFAGELVSVWIATGRLQALDDARVTLPKAQGIESKQDNRNPDQDSSIAVAKHNLGRDSAEQNARMVELFSKVVDAAVAYASKVSLPSDKDAVLTSLLHEAANNMILDQVRRVFRVESPISRVILLYYMQSLESVAILASSMVPVNIDRVIEDMIDSWVGTGVIHYTNKKIQLFFCATVSPSDTSTRTISSKRKSIKLPSDTTLRMSHRPMIYPPAPLKSYTDKEHGQILASPPRTLYEDLSRHFTARTSEFPLQFVAPVCLGDLIRTITLILQADIDTLMPWIQQQKHKDHSSTNRHQNSHNHISDAESISSDPKLVAIYLVDYWIRTGKLSPAAILNASLSAMRETTLKVSRESPSIIGYVPKLPIYYMFASRYQTTWTALTISANPLENSERILDVVLKTWWSCGYVHGFFSKDPVNVIGIDRGMRRDSKNANMLRDLDDGSRESVELIAALVDAFKTSFSKSDLVQYVVETLRILWDVSPKRLRDDTLKAMIDAWIQAGYMVSIGADADGVEMFEFRNALAMRAFDGTRKAVYQQLEQRRLDRDKEIDGGGDVSELVDTVFAKDLLDSAAQTDTSAADLITEASASSSLSDAQPMDTSEQANHDPVSIKDIAELSPPMLARAKNVFRDEAMLHPYTLRYILAKHIESNPTVLPSSITHPDRIVDAMIQHWIDTNILYANSSNSRYIFGRDGTDYSDDRLEEIFEMPDTLSVPAAAEMSVGDDLILSTRTLHRMNRSLMIEHWSPFSIDQILDKMEPWAIVDLLLHDLHLLETVEPRDIRIAAVQAIVARWISLGVMVVLDDGSVNQ